MAATFTRAAQLIAGPRRSCAAVRSSSAALHILSRSLQLRENRRAGAAVLLSPHLAGVAATRTTATTTTASPQWSTLLESAAASRPAWSDEWKALGLGAALVDEPAFPPHLFFVQLGFGVDQHGKESGDYATKAAIRAVRNAIEFNSIPGVVSKLPGGRSEMLIHVKLGVPTIDTNDDDDDDDDASLPVDPLQVAKVFPYGKLLPLEIVKGGGLSFHTGRVVEELGDTNDVGLCVTACVTLGYLEETSGMGGSESGTASSTPHVTYNTKDGY